MPMGYYHFECNCIQTPLGKLLQNSCPQHLKEQRFAISRNANSRPVAFGSATSRGGPRSETFWAPRPNGDHHCASGGHMERLRNVDLERL